MRGGIGPRRVFPQVGRKGRIIIIHFMQARRAACSHHAILSTVNTHVLSVHRHMTSSGPSRTARAFGATPNRPPTLPRLPVPDLHKTLSKYLQSLVPLLQEDEVCGGPSWQSALQERQRWANEFERGLGAKCQERLHGRLSTRCLFPSTLTRIEKLSTDPRPVTGWTITYG